MKKIRDIKTVIDDEGRIIARIVNEDPTHKLSCTISYNGLEDTMIFSQNPNHPMSCVCVYDEDGRLLETKKVGE